MSDETTQTTTTTPDAGAGGNSGTTPSPAGTQAAQPTPYRAFATEAELTAFVQRSKSQAERAALRKLASDMGFEDADELREALAPLRRGQGGATPQTPAATTQQQGPTAADRLQMAINVGKNKNLPVAIVELLKGDTEEAMTAHADQLVALFGPGQRGPGIPSAPQSGQPVTFTSAQLADPKFVREHAAEIQQAAREGRIVRS